MYLWIKLKQDEIQLQNASVHVKVVLELSAVAVIMTIVWFLGYGQWDKYTQS